MKLAVITAHAGAECLRDAVLSWYGELPMGFVDHDEAQYAGYSNPQQPSLFVMDGRGGMLPTYQRALEWAKHDDVLAYIHDDVIIHDPAWSQRVLAEFEDPKVGLVGFGGALGHGSPALYRDPYDYHQLGRSDFMSNMDDAENHGQRFTGARDAAVLDGFTLIVRRKLLERAGGWPVSTLGYVGYDYWLCCMARRLGYRIRVVGVPCQHIGGQTFVKLGLGRGEEHWQQFLDAHAFLYNEFRDVLPFRVVQP